MNVFESYFGSLINLPITRGNFPHELRLAKVQPLFKSGDPSLFTNYHPISVLPVISKVYEQVIYSRLLNYINDNNISYQFQFGFRHGQNSALALLTLVDKISSAVSSGEFMLGLFLDFKKAFDTINHQIFLDKLYKYGVKRCCINIDKGLSCL